MSRRVLALALCALLLALLLTMAGHALQHLGHGHDCPSCPVCVVLCAFERLLRRLALVSLVFSGALLQSAAHRYLSFETRSFLLDGLTPVGLKVKLLN